MAPWGPPSGIVFLVMVVSAIVWWAFRAGRRAARRGPPETGTGFEIIIAQCPAGHRCLGWTSWNEREKTLAYDQWFGEHKTTCTNLHADNKSTKQGAPGG